MTLATPRWFDRSGAASLLAVLAWLTLCAAPSSHAGQQQDAQAWLERLAGATHALNYDGIFVYHNDDGMQSMRIIHRADAGGGRERMLALTGEAREVIRDGSTVTCILPDDRSVLVGKSRPKTGANAPVFAPGDGFRHHYDLTTRPGERVAGRTTQLIEVRPRDSYRYGYHLSVDVENGLLLKSELRSVDGTVLELIEFTTISTPELIPDELLEPSIASEGFTRYPNHPAGTPLAAGDAARPNWETAWLPEGFELSEHSNHALPTARAPVEQVVYSDGLASLSVFVERLEETEAKLDGPSRMGAVNAFGRMIGDFQITVVGEVPAETVREVAMSVSRR